jgi:hypothetical protein
MRVRWDDSDRGVDYALLFGPQKLPPSEAGAGSAKPEAARQLLATYDTILGHLRTYGGLVNAVKPEHLLTGPDFDQIMEARSAAAAGDAAQEAGLESEWGDLEARFDELSARAWSTVLMQVRPLVILGAPGQEALFLQSLPWGAVLQCVAPF